MKSTSCSLKIYVKSIRKVTTEMAEALSKVNTMAVSPHLIPDTTGNCRAPLVSAPGPLL